MNAPLPLPAAPAAHPMDSVNERIASLMHDPSVSDWLKRAIPALLTRDPVDAALDAKILANLMLARAEASNK